MKRYMQLPFSMDIPIKTYQFLAYPLSILAGNIDRGGLCNFIDYNFVQTVWWGKTGTPQMSFDVDFFTYWSIFDCIEDFDKNIRQERVIYILKNILSKGHYIYCCIDEFFIPCRRDYMKKHGIHDLLIYGFNDEKKVFLTAGYDETMHYNKNEISYINIQLAYPRDIIGLRLLTEKIIKYSYKDIVSKLTSYLYSEKNKRFSEKNNKFVYGMKSFEQLSLYYKELKCDDAFDIKPYLIYLEHKEVLYETVKKLYINYNLQDIYVLNELKRIKEDTVKVKNLFMKYYLKRNTEYLNKGISIIELNTSSEANILHRFLKLIK